MAFYGLRGIARLTWDAATGIRAAAARSVTLGHRTVLTSRPLAVFDPAEHGRLGRFSRADITLSLLIVFLLSAILLLVL